jgi:hypothetical protein
MRPGVKVNVEDGFTDFDRIVAEEVEASLDVTALYVAREASQQLNTSGPGNPSTPGTPPARQTGNLARSFSAMQPRQVRAGRLLRRVSVAASVFYGSLHELGTSRLPRRPFLVPALNKTRPTLQRVFGIRLRRGIQNRTVKMIRGAS